MFDKFAGFSLHCAIRYKENAGDGEPKKKGPKASKPKAAAKGKVSPKAKAKGKATPKPKAKVKATPKPKAKGKGNPNNPTEYGKAKKDFVAKFHVID